LTCLLQRGLLFYIFILSQYGIVDAFERIEDFLELLLERDDVLSLEIFMSMSISMLEEVWSSILVDKALVVVESVIFLILLWVLSFKTVVRKKEVIVSYMPFY